MDRGLLIELAAVLVIYAVGVALGYAWGFRTSEASKLSLRDVMAVRMAQEWQPLALC